MAKKPKKRTAEQALTLLNRKTATLQETMGKGLSEQLDPPMLDLLDSYAIVRQTQKITPEFRRALKRSQAAQLLNDQAATELMEVLHTKLPKLPMHIRDDLYELGIDIRTRSRSQSLDYFSFSDDDSGPYFPIDEVYRAVDRALKRSNQSWNGLLHFSSIRISLRGAPSTLNYYMIRRIHTWKTTVDRFHDYVDSLSKSERQAVEEYSQLFYPQAVLELQKSFLTRVWDNFGPIRNAVSYTSETIFRNQFILMIARNLLCAGMVLFMVQFLGLDVSWLKFMAELMLGWFFQKVWAFAATFLISISWSASTFSFLGPLGKTLASFFAMVQDPQGASVSVLAALSVFGAGWIVGLSSMGLGVILAKITVSALVGLWMTSAKLLYEQFKGQGGTLSTLFAIHGVRYICTLFGWSAEDSYCNQFSSILSYTLASYSIGFMLFDIMADVRMFYQIARDPSFDVSQLAGMVDKSSCIQAAFSSLRPTAAHNLDANVTPAARAAIPKEPVEIKLNGPGAPGMGRAKNDGPATESMITPWKHRPAPTLVAEPDLLTRLQSAKTFLGF